MPRFKLLFLLVTAGLVASMPGCASFDSLSSDIVPPALIEKTSLPQPPPSLDGREFYIKMDILVGRDGSVRHVNLTKSSGDSEWDATAIRRIMQWKYSPALLDNKPTQMRIIQTARVVTSAPVMMNLSRIACRSSSQADSAYTLLMRGASFDSTATVFGSSVPVVKSGYVGDVDINQYPEEIRDELQRLSKGRFTTPLPLGPYWAIFMRH